MKFFEYQLKVERLCLNAGVLIVFRCSSVSTCLQQNKEKGPAQHAISEYCENYREISLTPLRLRPYQLQHTAGGEGGGTPDTERTFVCPSQRSANKDESASWMIFLSAALQLLHWKLVCRQIEGTSNSGRWRKQKLSSRIVIVVYCIRILTSGLLAKHISLGTQHIVSCYQNKCWRDTRWLCCHLYELDRLPGVERVDAGEVHRLLYDGLVPAEGGGSGGTWHVAGGHL